MFDYMVLMVLLGGSCWVIHYVYFGHRAMQEMMVLRGAGEKIYVNKPGWYYSDEVPDSERKAVMAIMTDDLLADLQKAIDEDGYPIMLGPIMSGLYPREEHPNTSVVPQYYREKLRKEGELGEMEELREKKVQALLSVLKSREQLAARCKGVPIEWLVDRLRFKEQ